jgi:DNA-binding response OmpR family regulator
MAGLLNKPNHLPISLSEERDGTRLRPLVLVVEDHDDTRALYKYVLELRGYQVIEAAAGDEAVQVAADRRPDLIVMDTVLPRVDGLTATRLMREEAWLHDVPIIFISGHGQPEFRIAALAAGGNDYLVKPVSINELESAVKRRLESLPQVT